MPTRYHRKTEALLAEYERPLGESRVELPTVDWIVPAAVAEWYTLPDAVERLAEFSNTDRPLPLHRLYAVPEQEHSEGAPLVVFMQENQAVCVWAILLNGSDDPPLLVDVEASGWIPCAASFSEFVYCGVFDHPPGWLSVWIQTDPLTDHVRDRLHSTFVVEDAITYRWPGEINRRYRRPNVHLTIWETEHPDWWIQTKTESDLMAVLLEIRRQSLTDFAHAAGGDAVADRAVADCRHRLTRLENSSDDDSL